MTATQKREIAFIDRGVDDLATLLAGIRPDVEPILLSNDEPAPRQMARAVQGREGLVAIHVIAHGRPGEVSFGAGVLSVETIAEHSEDLAQLGLTLGAGELQLWTCQTAQGQRGAAFVGTLAHIAGAQVAASTQLVGAAARDGQWALDVGSSNLAPLSAEGAAVYPGVMATSTTTVNDNNTSADLTILTTTTNATVNLNNSGGDDTVTTDGTGTTTVNANNSTGNDTIDINNASAVTVNLNNSTGNDDVDISGTTVNATVNDNNSGVVGGTDDIDITGTAVTATVNLNNSLGNDDVYIAGSSSTNATVNLNNSLGNDHINIGSATGATTATVNLNNAGGTDVINVIGLTANVTVNLTNSTGLGDNVMLVGAGTGTINAANSTANNTLIGANSTDTITGGIGNDTVDLKGAGTVNAGAGNDLGIYTLSDHYSIIGGQLQSLHGDIDYYNGQVGTDTLEIVLTAAQSNLAAVQTDLANYATFLASNPGASQTYTFHFGAASGALTVSGWEKLNIVVTNHAPTGSVLIAGTPQEGQILTADTSTLADADGLGTLHYQWQRSDDGSFSVGHVTNIGSDSATYHLLEADENDQIRVVVSYTDGQGTAESVTSAASAAVADITLAFTSTASISGTAQEGSTLTAVNGTLNDSDASVTSYQWQASTDSGATWSNITLNGTGSTYTAIEADEGHLLRVIETATDSDGGPATTSTSAASAAVADITLAFTSTASISGTAQEGSTLTAVNGTLNDSDASVTSYQWQASTDSGATWSNITLNGTGSTYTAIEADEGHLLRVIETATDSDGGPATTSTSAASAAVADITLAFTSTASISGTAQEGSTLTAVNGTLNDSDASVTSYQWQASTDSGATWSNITLNGTGSTYTAIEADEGHLLRVIETATDSDGGPATTSTSAASAAVADITLAFTSTASISGTAQEGSTLTAVNGTLNDSDASVTSYQWQASTDSGATWSNITLNGTGSTYTAIEADEGHLLRVIETATDSDGGPATTSTSAASAAVADITLAFTSTASISGTAQEGSTLTAVNGTLNDSDASVTSYQWQASTDSGATWSNITLNGTGSTYTAIEADEGHLLRVIETATDSDGGPATTSTSAASAAVADITLAFTSTASISGTAQEGSTLTAVNGTLNDSDASVTSYQWQASTDSGATWSNITLNGTGSTYTAIEADEGHLLRVIETATDSDGGPATTSTSAASAAVADITLAFTSTASISGTAQEGSTLTAVNGTLNDSDASVTSYQWQASTDSGATWSNITLNGTGSTYTAIEADEGHLLRVIETATDSDGGPATTSTSAASAAVADITLAFTSTASISGTAQEGSTLTAVNGTLNDSDASVTSYQWQASTDSGATWSNITLNGTGSTYTAIEADEGHLLRVIETATDSDGGPATTSTSAASAAVADITLAFTSTASISGTAQEGSTLTAVNGTLNDSDASVTSYQWQASTDSGATWSNITLNGTGSTYTAIEADEGHLLRVIETATDSDGGPATTSTSAASAAVADITLAFTSTASISGTAQEGSTLTAVNGTLNDSDASVTSYQWQASTDSGATWSNITLNGTGSTYTAIEADEGHLLRVIETATDSDGGPATTSTSAASAAVADITLAFTSTASISGTAQEGSTLTAVNGTLNDSDASVTSYQWQASTDSGATWSNITLNGTGSTYTAIEADEGHLLRVIETATDSDGGPATTSTSAASAAVADITLAFTSTASISGTAQEGSTLTAVNGTLNDSDASVTSYQWQASTDSGATWSNITLNGTGSTYTAIEADEGHLLRVIETATDSDGGPATTSTSAASAAVADITLAFTSTASISGTAQEGSTLTAVNGTLNDSDASVTSYQWQASTDSGATWSNITLNGTGSTYTAIEADEGHLLRVIETATDSDGGPATTSTSAASAAVADITLAFTSTASISGTAQEGSTLTAVNGTLNDSDASVTSYQWQASTDSGATWSNITLNGTGSTYTAIEADEGHLLRVIETATDSDGGPATTSTSAASAAVADITLAFTSTASISGTAQEGSTLTAVNGTLNDSDASVTSYQWQASTDSGATWSNITLNGTGSTYTAIEADEGHLLRVIETATDSDGGPATTSTSAASAAVADITLAFTSTASISGTAQEGSTLTAVNGTLNDSDASVTSYQWQASTDSGATWSNITLNGTGSTYTAIEADEGHLLRVIETATDSDGGPATTSTSAASAAVADITLAFTSTASISGTAQEGSTLTAVNGTLNDSDASVTGYQWTRDGVNITGATASTYTVAEADETHVLRVVETATDSDGGPTTTSTSAATAAVTDITLAFTTAASITGTAQEGQVLTAVNGTLNDSDASVTGYQWTRDGVNITGATASTYTVTEADETHVLRVVETATDSDGGPSTTSTSVATAAVTDITLAFTTAASITGTAQEGQVLTAVNGTLNDSDASVTGYQWTRDGVNITGATASTYTVTEADETHVLRVVETATDSDGGPSTTSTSAVTAAVTEISLLPTITAGTHTVSGNNGHVTFIVTFPEAVGTVVVGDFTLFGTATGSTNPPTIASISGSGASYTVTIDYGENKNAGLSLGLNFVNTSNLVHDTETGESGNLAVNTNITTAQFSSLAPAGVAGSPINLALTDPTLDTSDTITLTVTGVQPDWILNGGTENSDGSWTIHTSDPASLAITTSASFAGAAVIQVSETWTNADGSIGNAIVADNVEAYAAGSPIFALSGDDTLTASSGHDLLGVLAADRA